MGDGHEHGESDWRSMEQQYHPRLLVGVSQCGDTVCSRHDGTLVTQPRETLVQSAFCSIAKMGNHTHCGGSDCGRLSICDGRLAGVYLFPILGTTFGIVAVGKVMSPNGRGQARLA